MKVNLCRARAYTLLHCTPHSAVDSDQCRRLSGLAWGRAGTLLSGGCNAMANGHLVSQSRAFLPVTEVSPHIRHLPQVSQNRATRSRNLSRTALRKRSIDTWTRSRIHNARCKQERECTHVDMSFILERTKGKGGTILCDHDIEMHPRSHAPEPITMRV